MAATHATTAAATHRAPLVHPAWLRLTHWINALALLILVTSGWRIYNASPLFDFRFPNGITLGGWLAGALQWHFAAMWLLAANGIFYLALNLLTGRLRRKLLPVRPREVVADLRAALRGALRHADPTRYNAVQKCAYLGVIALLVLAVMSGLAMWKPVQLAALAALLGGYESARIVHFVAMSGLSLFFVVHIVMVALVPRTLVAMLRGR